MNTTVTPIHQHVYTRFLLLVGMHRFAEAMQFVHCLCMGKKEKKKQALLSYTVYISTVKWNYFLCISHAVDYMKY